MLVKCRCLHHLFVLDIPGKKMFVYEDYFETVIFVLSPSFVRPEGIDTLAFVAHQEEGKWDKLKKLNIKYGTRLLY